VVIAPGDAGGIHLDAFEVSQARQINETFAARKAQLHGLNQALTAGQEATVVAEPTDCGAAVLRPLVIECVHDDFLRFAFADRSEGQAM
jgi:hypothetical protein